jgi:hypothetical protein
MALLQSVFLSQKNFFVKDGANITKKYAGCTGGVHAIHR